MLAHRGMNGNNSFQALKAALISGFGFESDIRDFCGKLVISHDPADTNAPDAEEIFSLLADYGDKYFFAVNVKADGLRLMIERLIAKYNITKYFLFDMSVPQMVIFKKAGLKFFTGQSDIQPHPVLYDDAAGIWADCFYSTDWINADVVQNHIANGKKICFVSPELHGRNDYLQFWAKLKSFRDEKNSLMLCTDYPLEAEKFFNFKGGNYYEN